MSRAVGVDFGTSTSLVAERDGSAPPEVLPLGSRSRYVPSVAGLRGETLVVGEAAESMPHQQVIRSIKRFLTASLDEVQVGGVTRRVDEIVAAVLTEIAARAETNALPLGEEPVLRIGCPAAWTGPQRARLLELARGAGIPVSHASLVDEPVAAGVAWLTHRYLAHQEQVSGRALVFDMGGGTLDIAVLDVLGGAEPEIRVLASVGAPEAGDDLDQELAADFAALLHAGGLELETNPRSQEIRDELLRQARAAKVRLSSVPEVTIQLDPELFGARPPLVYGRSQLEAVFDAQLERALQLMGAALRAARLAEELPPSPAELRRMGLDELAHEVRHVVLAGGMSRIPVVAQRLGEVLPKAEIHTSIGHLAADELVVGGLSDTVGYDRISLHRPAYDFVLEWDGGRRVIYEAYTPLYQPWKVALGHRFLGHDWYGTDLPRSGTGTIRAYTPTGEPVQLNLGDDTAGGLRVEFGGHEFAFKIYCNGRILVNDGAGRQFAARVAGWPMLRGYDHDVRAHLTMVPEDPDPDVPWYHKERPESGAGLDMPVTATEDRVVPWYFPQSSEEDRWHVEPE